MVYSILFVIFAASICCLNIAETLRQRCLIMKKIPNIITIMKSKNIVLRARRRKYGYSLFLDIHYKNKRITEYLKLYLSDHEKRKFSKEDRFNLKLAETIYAKRLIEIKEGRYKKAQINNTNFTQYFKNLVKHKFEINDKSRFKWRSAYNHFHLFTNKTVEFEDINVDLLEKYKSYLLAKVSQNYARDMFTYLNSTLKKAYKSEIIDKNPMDLLDSKISQAETKRTFLLIDEIKTFEAAECPNQETKKAFLFCCFTGLRYSDVKTLTWDQIEKENGGYVLYFHQQKVNTEERIFLPKQALKYIGKRKKGKVFKVPQKKYVSLHMREWAKNAGINKKVTFHVSRHTFATLALTYDIDLKTVSTLLGHKDIRTTEIYGKIIDKKKEEAVKKLPEL